MIIRMAAAAALTAICAASPATAACRGSTFNIIEEQRIKAERRASPGDTCFHSFNARGLALAAITPVRKPAQGSIQPSATGRGTYEYRSNPGASGTDTYVIRAEFNRMDLRSGQVTGKTWAEVEFTVTFQR